MPETTTELRIPTRVRVPLNRSRYWDDNTSRDRGHWDGEGTMYLTVAGAYGRHMVGYIDSTGYSRRVQGGPIVSGPYAYAFEMSSVLSDSPDPDKATPTANVANGDLVELHGDTFLVSVTRQGYSYYITLTNIDEIDADR